MIESFVVAYLIIGVALFGVVVVICVQAGDTMRVPWWAVAVLCVLGWHLLPLCLIERDDGTGKTDDN